MKVLVWNINHNKVDDLLSQAAEDEKLDIIVVIEPNSNPGSLIPKINQKKVRFVHNSDSCLHVELYSRFNQPQIKNIYSSKRTTSWNIEVGLNQELTIIATHFVDKWSNTYEDQIVKIHDLLEEISLIESKLKHRNVILIGDFNLNPYDSIMYAPHQLHAISCRKTVKRLAIRKNGDVFYNPSWNLFGDNAGVPGTYYRSTTSTPYWFILDQVLIRPDLIDNFDSSKLKVLSKIGAKKLTSSAGIPIKKYSDHFYKR